MRRAGACRIVLVIGFGVARRIGQAPEVLAGSVTDDIRRRLGHAVCGRRVRGTDGIRRRASRVSWRALIRKGERQSTFR